MIEAEEQAVVGKSVAHPAIEAFAETALHRLSRCDEMPDVLAALRPAEHGVRGELGPGVADDHARLATPLDQPVSSRATHRPKIEVSEIAARHSRVTSSDFRSLFMNGYPKHRPPMKHAISFSRTPIAVNK